MISQEKQLDFLKILARPVMYNYPRFNKPHYNAQPYCDRCKKNLTNYLSSKETSNTDLCFDCFEFLKNNDDDMVISAPTSISHHSQTPSIVTSSSCLQNTQEWFMAGQKQIILSDTSNQSR